MQQRRTLILADVHLTRGSSSGVSHDLAAVVREHPGARVVFAGDLLDKSAEPLPRPSTDEAWAAHPALRVALAEHVGRGGELWLVSGNHDADVGRDGFELELASALGIDASARGRVRTTPWFFRTGGLHIEHGHMFDPDNAAAHPLAVSSTSLGVHFVEAFIAKTGAHAFLNANDGTPLRLFLSAFRWYGRRAPHIVGQFFRAAFSGLGKSGPFFPGDAEGREGASRLSSFAFDAGADEDVVRTLVGMGPEPTLASLPRTFARLYLDRVFATFAVLSGAALWASGLSRQGVALGGAGLAGMLASWGLGHNRYGGGVAAQLTDGARLVRQSGGAHLVVFGHAHREALTDGYANTGSFAFPGGAPGRPYLEIEGTDERPVAVRRYFKSRLPEPT